MSRFIETAIMLAAMCGFFGFIYPELCIIDDNYKVVMEVPEAEERVVSGAREGEESGEAGSMPEAEEGSMPAAEEGESRADIFRKISSAPPESIRIKSKLIEYLLEIS